MGENTWDDGGPRFSLLTLVDSKSQIGEVASNIDGHEEHMTHDKSDTEQVASYDSDPDPDPVHPHMDIDDMWTCLSLCDCAIRAVLVRAGVIQPMEDLNKGSLMGKLWAFLYDKDWMEKVKLLDEPNAQIFQDILDAVSRPNTLNAQNQVVIRLFRGRSRSLARLGILPSSMYLYGIERIGTRHVSGGGFADIWKGRRVRDNVDEILALKVPRLQADLKQEEVDNAYKVGFQFINEGIQ